MSGTRNLFLIWAALLLLLALTMAGSFAFTGPLSLAISFGAAGLKAILIFWFYMHLREEDGLNRVFAVGAIVWLAILMVFPAVDLVTR